MRRAARTDANQLHISRGLRQIGASVQILSAVGGGCPDLLVGFQGRNVLLEVKRPKGPRGGVTGRTLTPDQVQWHRSWRGQVAQVHTLTDALAIVTGR